MADLVLGAGAVPSVHPRELRAPGDAKQRRDRRHCNLHELRIGPIEAMRIAAKRLRSPIRRLREASVGAGVFSLLASANTDSSESLSCSGVITFTAMWL